MEFSSNGRLIAWLGISLSIFSLIFSNPAAAVIAIIVFAYLLYEGLSFRRIISTSAESLKAETIPMEREMYVGRSAGFVTSITSRSEKDFVILDARRFLPGGISETRLDVPLRYALRPHGRLQLNSSIKVEHAGNFVLSQLSITLGSYRTLFLEHISLPDKLHILGEPVTGKTKNPIDTDGLPDLAHDESRRGIGTDFAGLRATNYLDDYRLIDWKAVARFGKPLTREFYLDKDPTIMLLVDFSLTTGATGSYILEALQDLISNIRVTTPIGIILYDSRSIITTIRPISGAKQKGRIIRSLVLNHSTTQAARDYVGPHVDYSKEIRSLTQLNAYDSTSRPYLKRLSIFARTILPFYNYAESKQSERLGSQGIYLAFESISRLINHALIIMIADGHSNMEGLVKGAKRAALSDHKIVMVLLSTRQEEFEDLSQLLCSSRGITLARATPRNLVPTINSAILEIGHKRRI